MTIQNPKGKRKAKTVNQEVVEMKDMYLPPGDLADRDSLSTDKSELFQTDTVYLWSKKVNRKKSAEVVVAVKLL